MNKCFYTFSSKIKIILSTETKGSANQIFKVKTGIEAAGNSGRLTSYDTNKTFTRKYHQAHNKN